MIEKLIHWEEWDIIDDFVFQFEHVHLLQPIGKLKKDDYFDYVVFDFDTGTATFVARKEEIVFDITLTLKDKI